jgi:hypothetical protein
MDEWVRWQTQRPRGPQATIQWTGWHQVGEDRLQTACGYLIGPKALFAASPPGGGGCAICAHTTARQPAAS